MTSDAGWVSVRYSPQDAEEARALIRETWGDIEPADAAYHEWQSSRSPAGPAITTLAREKGTGRLIGQAVTIPVRVALRGEPHVANLCLNVATTPEWRGRGVFSALLDDASAVSGKEGLAFTFAFPNQASFPSFIKRASYTDVGSVPLLLRPINPQRLAHRKTGSRVLAKIASLAGLIWRPLPARPPDEAPDVEITPVESFDDSFTAFWERIKGRFPVMVVRDAAYLNWRFVEVPLRRYVSFAARSDGEVRGFTVLRVAPVSRFDAGLIVDLAVEPGELGLAAGRRLIDQAYSYFKECDLDILGSLALPHTDEFRLLRAKGFWVCPKPLEPQPFRLVVRCYGDDASPSRLALDARNWFITLGDYDAV
jgi:GNAT superfamily N-acetyltransferase